MVFKGNIDREDYIDFANYVFGFNGADRSFLKLLPKLFKEGTDSAKDTFFVKEGDRLAACVGSFPIEYSILGEKLPVRGIGNMAVHPRDRSKGYMKECMYAALEEMIAEGCAFSVLSGRRHRYNHFGYVKCGTARGYEVTAKTISYVLPDDYQPQLTMRTLCREDAEALSQLSAIWHARPFHCTRPQEMLYDILISWQSEPIGFFEGDTLVGWVIVKGSDVWECIADPKHVPDMLFLLSKRFWHLSYKIPYHDRAVAEAIFPYAETSCTEPELCFNILNYEKVLSLLLRLKATYEPLLDGETVVEIKGYAKTERLRLAVADGVPSVTVTDAPADATLSHLAAMRALFLADAPERSALSPVVRSWLPLPIYIYHADNV
ncbi:MAG: GNAT family N-acetyltransferase [Clostridia bacterium]|nr:GNAT family N-acetyltransferase [Clostridia bacterium]